MSNEKHAKCANIQRSKILPRIEMFREIFPEEERNHSNMNEWCGPRCGVWIWHVHGMAGK